jgi:nucleoside-diphosphate-sugar epimerase
MAAGGSDIDALLDLLDGRAGAFVYTSSIMAYDQSWVGRFPWTEDQPSNPDGPATYGGFKALVEAAVLARHDRTGFPGSVARPAAVYGPGNNIFDMELPMFLRLLQHRPILVPHGGLVIGSYGHVDDLCEAMIAMAASPASPGEIFNVSGESIDVNSYIAVIASVVGEEPDVVYVPDELLPELDRADAPRVFGHLFRARHHAMLSVDKLRRVLAVVPAYDVRSGHEHTFAWYRAKGYDRLDRPLVDPVWKASWDFDAEADIAGRIRG